MTRARRGTLLASIAVATACSNPPPHDAELYRAVLDQSVERREEPGPELPLTLAQAMAIANQRNEQLGLSGEDYVQALIDKNRAVAAFLPTLSFAPSYTIADKPADYVKVKGTSTAAGAFVERGGTLRRLEAPVVGDINVFRGFGDVDDFHAAEAMVAARRDLLLDLQATVLLNVAQTYYAVMRAEQEVAVLRHSVELQQARLADVERQLQNGLSTRLTVAQTRAQVDATRATLLQAESDVRNGRHTLALVIGLPAVANPLVDELEVPDPLDEEPGFEQHALDHRADLFAAHSASEAARHRVDAAFAQYYPSISLDVSYFLYREHFADASRWDAILTANLPIFSAGLIEADVRTAWSLLRQAALSESAIRRSALHDVQTAHDNVVTAGRRIVEYEDEVRAAEEAYAQAQAAFRNGLAINLDVLATQDELLQSQLALTAARFDRNVFYLDLVRATGEINAIARPMP